MDSLKHFPKEKRENRKVKRSKTYIGVRKIAEQRTEPQRRLQERLIGIEARVNREREREKKVLWKVAKRN